MNHLRGLRRLRKLREIKGNHMRKSKIKVRRHESGVWREAVVLNNIGGQLYVDLGGTFDWVCAKTHEIIPL